MTRWRDDPLLARRFHPEHPDDLQVLVHDGSRGPGTHPAEIVWARVVEHGGDHYVAVCLNDPLDVQSVTAGSRFRFVTAASVDHPLLVTEQYLEDRRHWVVEPCNGCGFDQLFDAPSDLAADWAARAPDESTTEAFTRFCPFCRGVQVVYLRSLGDER